MASKISVIVCDDHPLFRDGVCTCLKTNPDIEIVSEASDGEVCITKLELLRPDVLVTDLAMPIVNGFEVLKWSRSNLPNLRTYILSMFADVSYLQKAKELGACGFIAKEDAQAELLMAIASSRDSFYVSTSVGRHLPDHLSGLPDSKVLEDLSAISSAERKVLVLLTQSLTSKEIAANLNISARTVQGHRISLAEKLNAKGPNKLLQLAIKYRKEILAG